MMETNLDFYVLPDTDRNKLIIIDASTYAEAPESPILSITFPGFSKPISIPFIVNSANIINTSLLGLSMLDEFKDFGDGVYKLTYSICPNDQTQITKYHLVDNILKDGYADKLIDLTTDYSDIKHAKLDIVYTFMVGAEIQAKRNNPIMAATWYNRAVYLLSKLKFSC